MSTYSDISKKIGWHHRPCKPISFKEAEQLTKEIENGSSESFEKVFTLHRFMTHEKLTVDQKAAFMQIEIAFAMGRDLFA